MHLGILEQGRLYGRDAPTAIRETIELAQIAEKNGYEHFWLTEHHGAEQAWAGPEVLVSAIASQTQKIRVGPAGILLAHYSPVKVASDFLLLETLFPNRIDLGLAAAIEPVSAASLLYKTIGEADVAEARANYPKKVADVLSYMGLRQAPPTYPGHAVPQSKSAPHSAGRWSPLHVERPAHALRLPLD